ncbi:hypothetical protein [Brevibacillus sp. 179-C9.3 HS]|uniref:hypothetical protein n=1 Tax=unclassified Brevibacillus TaxID=2684853 RepID=UPI0039A1AAFD
MWINPFPQIATDGDVITTTSFQDAQAYVNFVILEPTILPFGTKLSEMTVRKETPTTRSSIRFEVTGTDRSFRIKQFFYDWSIPGIHADTNLVGQGEPFVLPDIAGFIGTDYKGNVAAAHARWFTQIELSVIEGHFEVEELLSFLGGLVPSVQESVTEIGQKAFALTSHTARFHIPRWTENDPINRVHWQSSYFLDGKDHFQSFICDSVGNYQHADGMEYQFLFRDCRNLTDCIWIWQAPKSLASPFPKAIGKNMGTRTKWNIEKRSVSTVEVILCEQATSVPAWQMHWTHSQYDYHIHVRANDRLKKAQVLDFVDFAHHLLHNVK